ncbi:MAG: ABC transporter permease [Bryobacteraceae bacterium]|nr:ABC transporter permease [Bryobacteraceae bacterium]
MSMWNRIRNVFRREALAREIEEELADHRAHGGRVERPLHIAEESRDIRLAPWLDAVASDVVFGWRQLRKNRAVTAAAVVSLALAIGSATSAFRLIDALLLRPLPVANPSDLYVIATEFTDQHTKTKDWDDSSSYPMFREMRDAVKDQAKVMALGYGGNRQDITFGADTDMEKASKQYVSGDVFLIFGLKPALGRLLTPADDLKPGARPVAVISYDYWTRRFGRDPQVIGKTFREGGTVLYEIVGVVQEGFTGTETGSTTDYFVPTMQNARAIEERQWSWFRPWISVPEESRLVVKEKLRAAIANHRKELMRSLPEHFLKSIPNFDKPVVELLPATAGVSGMQRDFRRPLLILGGVILLVLFIACANVANLMTAQAAARAREMALRVSIGAGRWRLIQLVLIESAMVAVLATILGGLFAWWSAPFVAGLINPPDNPVRLVLPADWRVLGFASGLALLVSILFGLTPAWKASSVKPSAALKGGDDPQARRRLMNALVAAQVAFCFLVHLGAGLFVATFDRLSNQPVGFDPSGVLTLDLDVRGREGTWAEWNEVAEAIRARSGVESATIAGWPLMSGNLRSASASVNGLHLHPLPYFLEIAPGWFSTMRIPLIEGRDFRPGERFPNVAIVNETFVTKTFGSGNPVGKSIEIEVPRNKTGRALIVGVARDARYRNLRETIQPTVYVPLESDKAGKSWGSLIVRTNFAKPESLATDLRATVNRTRSDFRVSNTATQLEHVRKHTIRERLLAMLSLFFAVVALILAAVGLYGVLNYSVIQRRREIGIRMALGAQPADVVRKVTQEVFAMLILGAGLGLALGLASERYVETLLFQVKATDLRVLLTPAVTLAVAAIFAALPPTLRAVRIDPAEALRSE